MDITRKYEDVKLSCPIIRITQDEMMQLQDFVDRVCEEKQKEQHYVIDHRYTVNHECQRIF